jgi:hypothetical protein
LLVVGVVAGTADASGFFTDDDSSVHLRAIEAIADEGITKGCNPPDNTLFCPQATVTREQMATFLVRALDLPAGSASFDDVGASVHAANIGALATAGITKGCNPPDNTLFCPTSPVTREQMATFLSRALDLDVSPRIVVNAGQDLLGVDLGTGESETVAALTALLGTPSEDTPYSCPYLLPTPNMRLLYWGSLQVTIYTVDTGSGLGLAGWRYGHLAGVFEPGGPDVDHIELPLGLELLNSIGDAATASGYPIESTAQSWSVVDLGYAQIEGASTDPGSPITGVHLGFGFACE